jgi:hypothetical protein
MAFPFMFTPFSPYMSLSLVVHVVVIGWTGRSVPTIFPTVRHTLLYEIQHIFFIFLGFFTFFSLTASDDISDNFRLHAKGSSRGSTFYVWHDRWSKITTSFLITHKYKIQRG